MLQLEADPAKVEFLESVLHPACQQFLGAARVSPSDRASYTQIDFSTKEAYTKAVGVGHYIDFKNIRFEPCLPVEWAGHGGNKRSQLVSVFVTDDRSGVEMPKGEWVLECQWAATPQGQHFIVTATGAPRHCVDFQGRFRSQLSELDLSPKAAADGGFGNVRILQWEDLLVGADSGADSAGAKRRTRGQRRLSNVAAAHAGQLRVPRRASLPGWGEIPGVLQDDSTSPGAVHWQDAQDELPPLESMLIPDADASAAVEHASRQQCKPTG